MKLVSILMLSATSAFAMTSLDLEKTKCKVEFLAIGTPSALKIRGRVPDDKPNLKGTVKLDGTAVTGTAKMQLDAFDTGMGLRNDHMKKNYLETAKYPTAEIEITKLTLPSTVEKDLSAKEVPFEGKLTLHGTTKPITGKSDVTRTGKDLAMTFEFQVPMTEYGITEPSFMGVKVNKPVTVTVAVNTEVGK